MRPSQFRETAESSAPEVRSARARDCCSWPHKELAPGRGQWLDRERSDDQIAQRPARRPGCHGDHDYLGSLSEDGTACCPPGIRDEDRWMSALEHAWPPELQVGLPGGAFFTNRRPEDVLVAERDGRIIGMAHLAPHSSMAVNAHVLHLNAIVVDPEVRGAGIGGLLVSAAIVEARHRGKRKLGLRVLGHNDRAIRLYERHGFVKEGCLRKEFRLSDGRYADDLWYALDLT